MRMKGIFLVVLLAFSLSAGAAACAEGMHIHTFGGSGRDTLLDVIALRDGGFLMVGNTLSNDGDVANIRWNTSKENCDAWAVSLDQYHNIRFQIVIGESENAVEQFTKAVLLPDGSLALLYEYIDEESHRIELQRYSNEGLFLGMIPIPPSTLAIQGLENSFLFAGGFREFYDDETDGPWLARYAFDGTPIWAGLYPDLGPWVMQDAQQDGKRLVCCGIWRESFSDYSGNILCLDIDSGKVLWNYKTEPQGYARLARLTTLSDGSAIAVGWKSGATERDGGLAVRVDKDGNQLWKKTVYQPEPDSAWFTDVLEISAGVVVSGAHLFGEETLNRSGWILMLNERGSVEQEKYVGESLLNLSGGRLIRGMDGLLYYFGTGGTESNAEDFFILRLDNPPGDSDPMDEFDGMGDYE